MDTLSAPERLAAFQADHRIRVNLDGAVPRCDVDGLRIHPTRNETFRHDMAEATALFAEAYENRWPSQERIRGHRDAVLSELAREDFDRGTVVVQTGPGYVVTADLEEVPEHNHFDWRDATDSCPRCQRDQLYAEG